MTLGALAAAEIWSEWARLLYFVPYTFLGNSLVSLPYDGKEPALSAAGNIVPEEV